MNRFRKYTSTLATFVVVLWASHASAMSQEWDAAQTRFLTSPGGTTGLPSGDLLKLGILSGATAADMAGNQDSLAFINAHFSTWATGLVGDGVGSIDGAWQISSSSPGAGFFSTQLYILAYNAATAGAATQVGLYTNPSWISPDSDGAASQSFDLGDAGVQAIIGTLTSGTCTSPGDIAGGDAASLRALPPIPPCSVTTTNIISGVISNWIGDYYFGSNSSCNVLLIKNVGALVDSGSGILGFTSSANNNAAVVTGTGSVWSNQADLYVGYSGTGNQLTISNGGAVFNGFGYVGGADFGSRFNGVTVSGTGSVWNNDGDLTIGYSGIGTNKLVIANGGVVYNVDGFVTANNNSALVTGSGSVWSNSGILYFGIFGVGNSLVISNGGAVFNGYGYLGYQGGGLNSVKVTGSNSLWMIAGDLQVPANNSVTMSDAGAVYDNNATVNGIVLVTGNGSIWSNNSVSLQSGQITVSGGSLYTDTASGNGRLNVNNGALVLNSGRMTVDSLAVNSGTVGFNGGVLNTKSTMVSNNLLFTVGNGSNSATLQLLGGVHSFAKNLHIAKSAVLRGCGTITGNVLVDLGATVVADCGGTMSFSGVFTNNGSVISANNTAINFYGHMVNNGLISASALGYLHFYGGVENNGTILEGNSTNSWIDPGDGKWEDSTKWSGAVPPAAAQSVILIANAATKTVTIDATTAASFPGSMTISNLIVQAPTGSSNILSVGSTGLALFEILNGCSVGSGGLLSITNSTVNIDGLSGGSFNIDGNVTFGLGAMTVTNGSVYIGNATNGSLIVNGGTLSARDLTIGNLAGSRGSFTVAGGTSLVGGPLRAGVNGAGTITVVGGQLVASNDNVTIGYSGRGQLTVSNGSVQTLSMIVGQLGGATGTVTANGGTLNVSAGLTIGDCASNALGQILLNGGNVSVSNASQTAFIDVRNGTLTVNGGVLKVDVLVMTNACGRIVWNGGSLTAGTLELDPNLSATGDGLPNGWKQAYGLDPLSSFGDNGPNGDPDHDGKNNLQEYLSGTDPTKSSSALRVTGIVREGNDIRVTWTCVGGHSYVLQGTEPFAPPDYSSAFADTSPIISVLAVGESTTNYLDVGAAYAPVLTSPGALIPTNGGTPSTVYISANGTRGLADASSIPMSVGSLLMLGTFSISEASIQSNYTARNLGAIMSAFSLYATPFAVGDGTSFLASWNAQRSAAGLGGQRIYLLAIDASTVATANQFGIFTAPAWVFPADGGQISLDLADVNDFVVGVHGGSLTINVGFGQTYTFSDTAKLNALPGRARYYRVRLVP